MCPMSEPDFQLEDMFHDRHQTGRRIWLQSDDRVAYLRRGDWWSSFARTGSGSLEGRPCSSDRLKTMATGTRPRRVRALPMSTLPAERKILGGTEDGHKEEAVARAGGVEDRPVLNYTARRT